MGSEMCIRDRLLPLLLLPLPLLLLLLLLPLLLLLLLLLPVPTAKVRSSGRPSFARGLLICLHHCWCATTAVPLVLLFVACLPIIPRRRLLEARLLLRCRGERDNMEALILSATRGTCFVSWGGFPQFYFYFFFLVCFFLPLQKYWSLCFTTDYQLVTAIACCENNSLSAGLAWGWGVRRR